MNVNKQISLYEFTKMYFPEKMKNTFHADFIEWLSNEIKDLPKGTTIILDHGRGKNYIGNNQKFRNELRTRINGFHATHIIIDDDKKE